MISSAGQRPPVQDDFIPFAVPSIGQEEIDEVIDTLKSGWITTGPKTQTFEQDFRNYVGAEEAVAMHSCTGALHVALSAMGVGEGDEVIVPTMTFCSTANVVVHLGARVVLVDVGDDLNIDVASAADAITGRTKAIMPVHYAGHACDLDELYALAAQNGLNVIEDAAHAVGSEYDGEKIGSRMLGPAHLDGSDSRSVVAFSFYATKNMTTAEGGMAVATDEELVSRMRRLALHGMSRDAWKRYSDKGSWYYEVTETGYKYNMTDLQAALGLHQLRRLDSFIEKRSEYAEIYHEALGGIDALQSLPIRNNRRHAYHLFPVLVSEESPLSRDELIDELRDRNIGTSVHFIPVHLHPVYQREHGYQEGDFPNAERIFGRLFSLPLCPGMTESDVRYVAAHLADTLQR